MRQRVLPAAGGQRPARGSDDRDRGPAAVAGCWLLAAGCALLAAVAPAGAQDFPPDPPASRGEVREVTFHSASLGSDKRYVVYLPPSYRRGEARRYPVAYYLHGAWGMERDWVRMGHLDRKMDSLVAAGMPEMIVVMPDGDDSWYTTWNVLPDAARCRETAPDSEPVETYCVAWPRYDEYVARDLVAHVDSTFRTLAGREHRGIGGLSMGGYGAVSLALAYPEVWSAAASHSGALAPLWRLQDGVPVADTTVPPMREVQEAYGRLWPMVRQAFGRDSAGWLARDPSRRAEKLWARDSTRFPALFVDVGEDDYLLSQSRRFRDAVRELGASLTYHEWEGAHSWDYWRAHVPESLAWMARQIAPR